MQDNTVLEIENRQYVNPQTGLNERMQVSMEFEHWKPVPSCDGYFVSNFGNVVTTKHSKMRKKALNKASNGYHTIVFYDKRFPKGFLSRTVHSLVVEAFWGVKSDVHTLINHIDGDKTNNRLDNLELCTRSYNAIHAQDVLDHWSGVKRVPVKCVELNQCFPSVCRAASTFGINEANVRSVLKGDRETAGGYHWCKI